MTTHTCHEPYWEPQTLGEVLARDMIDRAQGRETPKWHIRRDGPLMQQFNQLIPEGLQIEDGALIGEVSGCLALWDQPAEEQG